MNIFAETWIKLERILQDLNAISIIGYVPGDGISRSPEEFTENKDIEIGAFVLLKTLLALAKEGERDE